MPLDNPNEPHKFLAMEPGSKPCKIRLREYLGSRILHLTLGCPHNQDSPSFCPLHEVRKLEPCMWATWTQMLTDEDLEYLYAYHEICLHWQSTDSEQFHQKTV